MLMIKKKPESFVSFRNKFIELCKIINGKGQISKNRRYFKVKGVIKPTLSSNDYLVEFYYVRGGYPSVWVYGLLSKEMPIEKIPHHYRCDKKNKIKICLFRTKYHEYDEEDSVVNNVIPWTCEWLHFYELYLITGVWYGNGEHPKKNEKK